MLQLIQRKGVKIMNINLVTPEELFNNAQGYDRTIKMHKAVAFLNEGHKVQFTMLFRGRERMFRDRALAMFNEILTELGETVKIERNATMEGRRMTMVVAPTKRLQKVGTKS